MSTSELFNNMASTMGNHGTLSIVGLKSNIELYENQIFLLSERISELKLKLAVEKAILKNKEEKIS